MNSSQETQPLRYVLITPARNEEEHIEKTLRSMVAQTIHPVRWVIVSDGSTDATDQIAQSYASKYDWIEVLRMPEHRDRHFAAKVGCFNAGYAVVKDLDYDVIGNLDGDISFDETYFSFLLQKFVDNPKLGVAGTPFTEGAGTYDYRFASVEHVSGACQLFRRECFEEIGGYIPIKGGAIDWAAVTTARMKGWHTRTFTDMTCFHHRPIGTGGGGRLSSHFRQGKKDYYVGGHPCWELFRGVFRMKERPLILGGVFLLMGYLWALVTRMKSPLSPELKAFHRAEQMTRLRSMMATRCPFCRAKERPSAA